MHQCGARGGGGRVGIGNPVGSDKNLHRWDSDMALLSNINLGNSDIEFSNRSECGPWNA